MTNNQIAEIQEAIVKVLTYFGLFSYPLKIDEIHRFLGKKATKIDMESVLQSMLKNNHVSLSKQGLFTMEANEDWSWNRKEGNERAEKLLYESHRYIKKIIRFPFVRSVAISGSLSKYYIDEDADIDYFIITSKNRLWISRTLLHFYKKFTFLKGNEHFYCMNYFMDESALEIDQKNVYSAIETVTLIPVFNKDIIIRLKELNRFWVDQFLPNEEYSEDLRFMVELKSGLLKRLFERAINIFNPDGLNRSLMNATDKKWRKKWTKKSYPMEKYNEAFYTTINVSKNHPANYQSQVLNALESKDEEALRKDFEECKM